MPELMRLRENCHNIRVKVSPNKCNKSKIQLYVPIELSP